MKIFKLNRFAFLKFVLSCFFISVVSLSPLNAQTVKFKVTRYNASDGLADNSLYSIIQDYQGFLWFGTRNGLHKYDGYSFKVYRNDINDSSTIAQNWIFNLFEDRNKNLWIGTKSYLSLYIRETDSFRNFKILQNDVGIQSVSSITEDKFGRIWLSIRNRGIYIFDQETEKITPAREIFKVLDKTFKHTIVDGEKQWDLNTYGILTSIVCNNSSEIWIGTSQNGLYCFNMETNKIVHYYNNYNNYNKTNNLSNNNIKDIFKCKDGTIWIGTEWGLNRFDRKTSSFENYFSSTQNPYSIAENNIHDITEDNNGNLWIVTLDGWVNFLNKQSNKFSLHKKLTSLRLSTICVDRSGIIWIGSIDEGLFKLDQGIIKFGLYTQKPDESNSIHGTYIQAIETDNDDNIWIGGEKHGIHKINRQTGTISYYKTHTNYAGHPIVHDLLFDVKTGIWAATNYGVFIFDKSGKKQNSFFHDTKNPYSLSESQINNIFKDSKGNIWLATNIFNLYNRKTGKFNRFNKFENNNAWYPTLTISESDICEDKYGNFWMGTYIMGLLKFNPKTKLFKGFKKNKDEITSVSHLTIDKKGYLWYSKNRQGLTLFDINDEREIKHITEKDGLLHNAIQSIKEDDSGNLWISSYRGLTRYNPENNTFKHYFKEDGLQDNEFRFYASHKNENGELFFAGQYGLNFFHPDSIKNNDYIPPVVLTDFKISAKSLDSDYDLSRNISITEKIELSYSQNDFIISFAALHFSLPHRNKYSYILENYDNTWHMKSSKNNAEYTNLDPGEYTFKVKGTNSDGVWNEKPTILSITIYPPWWQTWWAYSFYILIIISLVYSLRRYELNRLHFKNKAKIETTKLKEREEVDRLKTNFFTNISHEFRTPLTLIIGPLNKLISDKEKSEDTAVFRLMRRNAKRLLNLINQLLDISKLESGNMKLVAGIGDIVSFVKGILNSFHSLAEHNNISVQFLSDTDKIEIYFDREKAEKIFTNILSNAFKFTPDGGEVSVNINQTPTPFPSKVGRENYPSREGLGVGIEKHPPLSPIPKGELGWVSVTISNTGPGIPAEKLPYIFDRFYQADDSMVRDQEGTGIGLALTKELVELHHGTISVSSLALEKTEFMICLPTGSDHLKPGEIIDSSNIKDEIHFDDDEIEIPATLSEKEKSTSETVVLVVEDNADMRSYINETLREKYKVELALDGEEGVKAAREIIPDLIISDLMMPKKDGYQLCSEVKQDKVTSHIPVILLTAKADREDKLQGLETGVDDYLIKPFDSKELLIRIKNLVEQRQRLRERFTAIVKVEPKDITVTSMDAEFLQKAMDIIEDNITNESLSVEMMSAEIGLSRRQFYQKIKALTDFTPSDFILNLRLKKAASLLSQKAGTVSEIAFAVGFNNLSYFTRTFKKQFGITPSKYEIK